MPGFLVDPAAVADASLRLSTVAGRVQELQGQLGRHHGAGAGTPAAGAFDDLLAHFANVLPQFALAGEHLSRAVGAGASDYVRTDSAVAHACDTGTVEQNGAQT